MMFLYGIRVVQVGGGIAGGYATRLLALAGADVILVEPPGTGDLVREIGPFAAGHGAPEGSLLHQYLGAGKRSLACDLDSPDGRSIVRQIVAGADLLIDSLGPGRLQSLDLLADAVPETIAPSVVSVSNFGQDGPDAALPATDITLEAAAGLMYITGESDLAPLKDPEFVPQLIGGMFVAVAGLTGVLAAQLNGQVHSFDVSLAESLSYFLDNTLTPWSYEKRVRRRGWGFRSSVYPCADGYIGAFDGAGRYWSRFPALMNEPRLADPKFATADGRTANIEEMEALMLPWLLDRSREQIYHEAQAVRLPFGPIRTMADLAASPHLRERGFVQSVDHPVFGQIETLAAPFRHAGEPVEARRAPLLGEHTQSILDGLAYQKSEIDAFKEQGVIAVR